jgi:hypothetical protein
MCGIGQCWFRSWPLWFINWLIDCRRCAASGSTGSDHGRCGWRDARQEQHGTLYFFIFLTKLYFWQCCGSGMLIPDPDFLHPGSASKNLSILTQKIVAKPSEICSGLLIPDPGFFSSRIRIKEFKYFNPKKFFPNSRNMIPDPGSRGQKGTWSRIRIRNTDCWNNKGEFLLTYQFSLLKSSIIKLNIGVEEPVRPVDVRNTGYNR